VGWDVILQRGCQPRLTAGFSADVEPYAILGSGPRRITRKLPEAGPLVREMLNVRTQSGFGKVRLGAAGYSEHDDLVIALALACWRARCRRNPFPGALKSTEPRA
jgi:hypothetical protein